MIENMKNSSFFIVAALIVALGGIATGVGVGKLRAKEQLSSAGIPSGPIQQVAGNDIKDGQVFGSSNPDDFKDSAEGYLEVGGIDGEGSHHLLREGGVSQTVYLTSSVTDLDKFNGMQVKVWGETFTAKKAGWLMDVGRVQVINTKAAAPTDPNAPALKKPGVNQDE